ncbi:hypothetical protein PoB_003519800 [Plakobranchus ocellatus]|uniref:Uncharacterized protein n=1 Tax=Plakobranchus ocellatus TaxID=259542 RepID=A0AAV4AN15_9GAST|nr:hypothetical protein PoB_003519800 [Plakobranchus ocellatus]
MTKRSDESENGEESNYESPQNALDAKSNQDPAPRSPMLGPSMVPTFRFRMLYIQGTVSFLLVSPSKPRTRIRRNEMCHSTAFCIMTFYHAADGAQPSIACPGIRKDLPSRLNSSSPTSELLYVT